MAKKLNEIVQAYLKEHKKYYNTTLLESYKTYFNTVEVAMEDLLKWNYDYLEWLKKAKDNLEKEHY